METVFDDLGTEGKHHDDTQEFDDIDILEDCKNVRLIRIRVWFDDYVYGLQTIYETSNKGIIVSPKRIKEGVEVWNLQYQEFFFNRNESIIAFRGH